jgi:CRP-like cAMP-binding protein
MKGLSAEEAERLLELGTRITVSSGSELFGLGDEADSLFLIARGRIRLTLPLQVRGQQEEVLVEERAVGQTVGWSALTPPYRFTLKAVAPLDAEVISLSREQLRNHFADHPAVGHAVMRNLAGVVGQRLQLFQAMWLREMQRAIDIACGA